VPSGKPYNLTAFCSSAPIMPLLSVNSFSCLTSALLCVILWL
jgi:hypothetical protein